MLEKFITNHIIHHLSHTPTPQQLQLIQHLSYFLTNHQERRCFVLNGYAGTGKTTVVSALVKTMQALNQHCVLLAPTGRAAKVISKYASQRAFTIHKYIYIDRTKETISIPYHSILGTTHYKIHSSLWTRLA